MSKKTVNDNLRARFMSLVLDALEKVEYEVLETNSNEFAVPCVDENGDDSFITIKFSIPSGSRDGDPYDGYAVADEYKLKVAERNEKAKASAEKKAQKIAKDKEKREALAKAKAEREANA